MEIDIQRTNPGFIVICEIVPEKITGTSVKMLYVFDSFHTSMVNLTQDYQYSSKKGDYNIRKGRVTLCAKRASIKFSEASSKRLVETLKSKFAKS